MKAVFIRFLSHPIMYLTRTTIRKVRKMLNDVMTLAEASVIWGIKYEGLLKCITAGPLDQPKFHDDEVDKIQDTWVVTRQAMERQEKL